MFISFSKLGKIDTEQGFSDYKRELESSCNIVHCSMFSRACLKQLENMQKPSEKAAFLSKALKVFPNKRNDQKACCREFVTRVFKEKVLSMEGYLHTLSQVKRLSSGCSYLTEGIRYFASEKRTLFQAVINKHLEDKEFDKDFSVLKRLLSEDPRLSNSDKLEEFFMEHLQRAQSSCEVERLLSVLPKYYFQTSYAKSLRESIAKTSKSKLKFFQELFFKDLMSHRKYVRWLARFELDFCSVYKNRKSLLDFVIKLKDHILLDIILMSLDESELEYFYDKTSYAHIHSNSSLYYTLVKYDPNLEENEKTQKYKNVLRKTRDLPTGIVFRTFIVGMTESDLKDIMQSVSQKVQKNSERSDVLPFDQTISRSRKDPIFDVNALETFDHKAIHANIIKFQEGNRRSWYILAQNPIVTEYNCRNFWAVVAKTKAFVYDFRSRQCMLDHQDENYEIQSLEFNSDDIEKQQGGHRTTFKDLEVQFSSQSKALKVFKVNFNGRFYQGCYYKSGINQFTIGMKGSPSLPIIFSDSIAKTAKIITLMELRRLKAQNRLTVENFAETLKRLIIEGRKTVGDSFIASEKELKELLELAKKLL